MAHNYVPLGLLVFLLSFTQFSVNGASLPCFQVGGNCSNDQTHTSLCSPIVSLRDSKEDLQDLTQIG
jgi:hypothetical protein